VSVCSLSARCVGVFVFPFRRSKVLSIRFFRLQGGIVVAGIEDIVGIQVVLLMVIVTIGLVRRRPGWGWSGRSRRAGQDLPVNAVASGRVARGE
jgi:hypothetical protein